MNSSRFSVGGAFQVEHELLEFLRHGVEGGCQFADLGAARELDALREISASDGPAGFSQHFQRIGNAAGRKDTDADTEQHSQQSQQARRALHLVNAAVGFVAGLLHDHRPVQVRHRAVGAEHLRAFLAFSRR